MSKEGFQLDPSTIGAQIHSDMTKPGWHLTAYLDSYARPDFDKGFMVHDQVDRAVVVFVGSRAEAAVVHEAAHQALRNAAA